MEVRQTVRIEYSSSMQSIPLVPDWLIRSPQTGFQQVRTDFAIWYRTILPNRLFLMHSKNTTPAEKLDWLARVNEYIGWRKW